MLDRLLLLSTVLILFLFAGFTNDVAAESPPKEELPPLEPTKLMEGEAKWLGQVLQRVHYSKVSLRKLDKKGFLKTYMSRLDRQRMYFLESDWQRFSEKFAPTIATYAEEGNLYAAFEIYSTYRTKALARMEWVLKRLEGSFSLEGEDDYVPDREKVDWPATEKQTDEVWELRLKYEVLGEVLSLINSKSGDDDAAIDLDEKKEDAPNQTEQDDDDNVSPEELNEHLDEARDRLQRRYQRWHKSIGEFEAADVQELYLTTLTQMFDPHSTFLNIDAVEEFNVSMKNSFVGIGAVLKDEDGYCTIKELLPGGPAEESQELEPEDIILKVAQGDDDFVDVVDTKLKTIVKLIKGPKDTIVRLLIKPVKNPSERKIVPLERDEIKLTGNLASASVHELPDGESTITIGVIELPSFYGDTRREKPAKASDDVAELIGKLKKMGVDGLVLDLRRNGGGFLSEAINLAGLFISRGPVVQVRGTDGRIIKRFDFNSNIAWNGPLALLVSRYSASASEIVAGALQHHDRAIIVGDSMTHGKGTVQSMIEMNAPAHLYALKGKKRSAAKITIQKYYLPNGKSTQNIGVSSDIKMNSINEFLPIGESDLPHALENDEIPAVVSRRGADDFVIGNGAIAHLNKLSRKRQESLPEFDYLQTYIDWSKDKRDQKAFSLNLNNRLKQNRKDDAFREQMNETMKKLAKGAYSSKPVKLDVVLDLERRSKKVRDDKIDKVVVEEKDTGDEEEKVDGETADSPSEIDIRLREGLRIMIDWIRRRTEVTGTVKETPTPEKKS
ncbi:MAG: tail-specific protease [Opitutales bacterium]|nr:tail-specific protease [Opitutales bacterium]